VWLTRALLLLLILTLSGASTVLADGPDELELFHLKDLVRQRTPPTSAAKVYPGPPEAVRARLAGPLAPKAVAHPDNWLIPDSEFVLGPTTIDFDVRAFVEAYPGYLKHHVDKVDGVEKDGAEIVELVARRYSVNPRIILALLEWKGGWLTKPEIPANEHEYAFGYQNWYAKGLYKQLEWVTNYMNAGYYAAYQRAYVQLLFWDSWRARGPIEEYNQGSYALAYFLARMSKQAEWDAARAPDGEFMQTYRRLFGDPWRRVYEPLIPAGLQAPALKLPFAAGETWWFTGAPHGGWGPGSAWGAIDFAPGLPTDKGGCVDMSAWWVRASAPGLIALTDYGEVFLDLDGDGNIQTGWVLIYNHIGRVNRVEPGTWVKTGDPIGHATCEGGWSSGVHVHLARRYNGVWINSNGPQSIPFYISGYYVTTTGTDYLGTLTRVGEPPRRAIPWRVPGENDVVSDNVIVGAQR
jgi:LasA protease